MKALTALGLLILGLAITLLYGFAVMKLWNWFVPISLGLSSLTYFKALGISTLCGLLTHQYSTYGSLKSQSLSIEERSAMYGAALGGPLGALLMGWIITLLM